MVGVHALRNALIPVVTVIGLQVGTLLAGAILTETIFSWPGIGKWLVEAIHRRDYPVVQGGILLIGDVVIARQPGRRPALRRGQPADPRMALTMQRRSATVARATAPATAAVAAAREFWRDFRRNRGAVIGLRRHRAACLCALFADVIAPLFAERAVPRRDADAAVAGSRRRPRASCSAPTRWAATCSRA